MSTDFTYFYKNSYLKCEELLHIEKYDVFISFFNGSDRVNDVFNSVNSDKKYMTYFSENKIDTSTFLGLDEQDTFELSDDESESIINFIQKYNINKELNICVDITGFHVPHLLFLIKYLHQVGFKIIDAIYSEPNFYKHKEKTVFSEDFNHVRQIHGYEGVHNSDVSNDIVIIGSGYDNSRITDISTNKNTARKIQLFGFPSLQPDMYQENILKAYKAEASVGGQSFIDSETNIYAPANDPFVAAEMIKKFIIKENSKKMLTNIYLSPISTKAHALGFALYFLWECNDKPISIIYPFCGKNYGNTSIGISKILRYRLEFI